MQIVYLHGFASSPLSKKAQFFKPHFESQGFGYHTPDLNEPSFEQLTLTAMLAKAAETLEALGDEPICLIGSSMGGLTALHTYDRYRQTAAKHVQKMVLLAPAFDFMSNRQAQMGEGWQERWQTAGSWNFYNYAIQGESPVHYGLVEDMQQYHSYAVDLDLPTLIYHGKNDDVVDYQQSVKFAEKRPNVDLRLLDSDHQLLDKTEEMLAGIMAFLGK